MRLPHGEQRQCITFIPMRVAALDLGTNTTRLLVADVANGSVEEVVRRSQITRLGEGVDARHRLLPLPITRVRNCLADYRRELEALGAERALAVATSAIRDADNGEAFLGEVEWSYGFKTRLLSGEDEALLTLRGVASGRELDGHTLVIDVGGGSTELVAGFLDSVAFRISTELGSVRLTERYLRGDPPGEGELSVCAAAIRSLLGERVPDEARGAVDAAIAVAGTTTSLAALDLGLVEYEAERVDGHKLTHDAVHAQLTRLAAIPLEERRQVPGLEPERAPVIVAGAMILRETMRYFALDEVEVSERDLLDGAALEAAQLPEPVEGDAPPGAYTCC
jgi:exopolyphosphatase/guanosine-5'-triphosphate,3'-diphosphate pyrophosphatase